eukprot:2979269-Rhodomonas_salina.3
MTAKLITRIPARTTTSTSTNPTAPCTRLLQGLDRLRLSTHASSISGFRVCELTSHRDTVTDTDSSLTAASGSGSGSATRLRLALLASMASSLARASLSNADSHVMV